MKPQGIPDDQDERRCTCRGRRWIEATVVHDGLEACRETRTALARIGEFGLGNVEHARGGAVAKLLQEALAGPYTQCKSGVVILGADIDCALLRAGFRQERNPVAQGTLAQHMRARF